MRLFFPHQSLCGRANYDGYREQGLINKLTNSPPSGQLLLIIVIEYLYSATFLEAHADAVASIEHCIQDIRQEAHGGLQQKKNSN